MSYISPPKGEDCQWFKGSPPEIGWWPASLLMNNPEVIRWWDGSTWSSGANHGDHRESAAIAACHKESESTRDQIEWTHRWWPSRNEITKEEQKVIDGLKARGFGVVILTPSDMAGQD